MKQMAGQLVGFQMSFAIANVVDPAGGNQVPLLSQLYNILAMLIFLAVPMAASGGIFALSLRGMPFSISAGVGFIALAGVAAETRVIMLI